MKLSISDRIKMIRKIHVLIISMIILSFIIGKEIGYIKSGNDCNTLIDNYIKVYYQSIERNHKCENDLRSCKEGR